MMRAAIYVRYSSDLQNSRSIEDQLSVCRRLAEKHGFTLVASFEDAALSGASVANRPGFAALMKAAEERAFDLVVCEALDRLSRSQADVSAAFEDLRFYGVGIHTISEGAVSELHIGLAGTMNALQLREIGRKTKRGLQGVASAGRHTGGRVYGYSRDRRLDDHGELIRGLLAINPTEAEIVRRILKAYAAGQSPRSIASDLNAESIPAPGGSYWNASTINGNARRGNGILHNELYRGVLVFGRQTWVKDRRTGRRHARDGDPSEIIRTPVPHLRIVSDRLWRSVRKTHNALSRHAEGGSHRTVRPKHLLSGLMRCGACGGPLIRSGSGVRFICSRRRESGVCANGRSVPGLLVEAAYAEGLERLPANKARETLSVHLANLRASDGHVRPPLEALRLVRELTASVVVTPLEERGRFAFDVRWLDETSLSTL